MRIILSAALLILVTALSASCKKEEHQLKEFYINQDRDADLIGTFHYYYQLPDQATYQIWEFKDNAECYKHSVYNGEVHLASVPEYWYTNANIIHFYNYKKSWMYGSWEENVHYTLSGNKDTLYIDSQPFIKQ